LQAIRAVKKNNLKASYTYYRTQIGCRAMLKRHRRTALRCCLCLNEYGGVDVRPRRPSVSLRITDWHHGCTWRVKHAECRLTRSEENQWSVRFTATEGTLSARGQRAKRVRPKLREAGRDSAKWFRCSRFSRVHSRGLGGRGSVHRFRWPWFSPEV
jgi:hypothetical protein